MIDYVSICNLQTSLGKIILKIISPYLSVASAGAVEKNMSEVDHSQDTETAKIQKSSMMSCCCCVMVGHLINTGEHFQGLVVRSEAQRIEAESLLISMVFPADTLKSFYSIYRRSIKYLLWNGKLMTSPRPVLLLTAVNNMKYFSENFSFMCVTVFLLGLCKILS